MVLVVMPPLVSAIVCAGGLLVAGGGIRVDVGVSVFVVVDETTGVFLVGVVSTPKPVERVSSGTGLVGVGPDVGSVVPAAVDGAAVVMDCVVIVGDVIFGVTVVFGDTGSSVKLTKTLGEDDIFVSLEVTVRGDVTPCVELLPGEGLEVVVVDFNLGGVLASVTSGVVMF